MIRLIKRYGSRKLYDTEESRYVALDELAGWIRTGQQIKVIDNKTSDDVTAQTLTQIISEEGRRGTSLLPNELLHELIRAGEQAVQVAEDLVLIVRHLGQAALEEGEGQPAAQAVGQFLLVLQEHDLGRQGVLDRHAQAQGLVLAVVAGDGAVGGLGLHDRPVDEQPLPGRQNR